MPMNARPWPGAETSPTLLPLCGARVFVGNHLTSPFHDAALVLEGELNHCRIYGHPPCLVHFPVVISGVARGISEQKKVNQLVKANLFALVESGVPVFDRLDVRHDFAGDAAFFPRLSDGSRLRLLTIFDEAFRKLPPVLAANCNEYDRGLAVAASVDNAARGNLIPNWQLRAALRR